MSFAEETLATHAAMITPAVSGSRLDAIGARSGCDRLDRERRCQNAKALSKVGFPSQLPCPYGCRTLSLWRVVVPAELQNLLLLTVVFSVAPSWHRQP